MLYNQGFKYNSMASFVPCNQSHLVEKDEVVLVKQQTDVWTTLSLFSWEIPTTFLQKIN